MTAPSIRHRDPVVIIGIGNPMRRDDGIGPAIIEACERDQLRSCDLVQLDGEATRVIEAWRDRQLAIVVDAICTGAPAGTLHDLSVDQLASIDTAAPATSSHYAGLIEALTLGRALRRLPASLRILGIEPEDLDHGLGLSAPVTNSLDALLERVHAACDATETTAP